MQKAFLCSILVLFVLLTLAIASSPAKAARLELDEASSTCFISHSVFAYAGAGSDSDSYQNSGIDQAFYPIDAVATDYAGAVAVSGGSCYTCGGDYFGAHTLVLDTACQAYPYIYEDITIPAGFSTTMNAEGNLFWEILPSTEDEDSNLPVFLHIDFSLTSVGGGGSNANYEMGIYDYTFGPEAELSGPYYIESYCCPSGQDSTFPEERDLWVVAHFGDFIGLSYNTSVSGGTDDPMMYSELSLVPAVAAVVVYQFIYVYPPEVFFLDRERFEEVEGACSDGETRVSVELTLPYELFPNDENPSCIRLTVLSADGRDNGHLTEEGQDNDGDDYDDTPRIAEGIFTGIFTQTWNAPTMFDNVEAAGNTAKSREIPIQFEIDTDNDGTYDSVFVKHIDLVRPPVVMVHGLWGNGGDFGALARQLEQNGWLKDLLYHPSYDNKASLEHNKDVVPTYVKQALTRAHDMKYACSKVDIVAHSMGGLLAKRINPQFAAENIRKIITVGTPYAGSPFADRLFQLFETDPEFVYAVQEILNFFLATGGTHAIDGGAVYDLRSEGNNILPIETQVPGVDCRGIIVGYHDGTDEWLPTTLAKIITGIDDAQAAHENLFGVGTMSDWIVSVPSQKGDAGSWDLIPVGWHSTEPKNLVFQALVLQWLNEPAQIMQQIANTPSRKNRLLIQSVHAQTYLSGSSQSIGTIEITSPVEGQNCTIGQPLNISLQGTGNTSKAAIFAGFGSLPWADIVQTPWTGDVNVPPDSVGSTAKIFAIGLDANMNMTGYDEVNLVLESDIVLQEIFLGFGDTWYFDFITDPTQSRQLQLYPMGRFSDDSEHPLSVLENQTTYQSLNECVATVDSNGIITVHSKGQASIVVTNSSITTTVLIEVDTCSWDLDLDGDVDFVDFALFANQWQEEGGIDLDGNGGVTIDDLAIFTEHWLEGTWHPIPGDINGNSKVDFADFALLANNWLETDCEESNNWCEGADFDKNGDVGLTDLAEITKYWLEGI